MRGVCQPLLILWSRSSPYLTLCPCHQTCRGLPLPFLLTPVPLICEEVSFELLLLEVDIDPVFCFQDWKLLFPGLSPWPPDEAVAGELDSFFKVRFRCCIPCKWAVCCPGAGIIVRLELLLHLLWTEDTDIRESPPRAFMMTRWADSFPGSSPAISLRFSH